MWNFTWIEFIIVAIVVGLVGWLGFVVVDSAFIKTTETTGQIIGHEYHPAYTTTTIQKVGDVSYPQTIHHPERWEIVIKIKEGIDSIDVSKTFYYAHKDGTKVGVDFGYGRLTKSVKIKAVYGFSR